jgi:hypothetical protein
MTKPRATTSSRTTKHDLAATLARERSLPFLSETEIAEICAPLSMPAYQAKYLKRLGLIVNRKPNGRLLVARGEFERVLIGRQPEPDSALSAQPNRAALLQVIEGSKRGQKAQRH